MPRVLGQDRHLYTIVEINGYPEVVDVQLVSVLDTRSRATLENQVVYDSLACGLLVELAAQKWCAGRILKHELAWSCHGDNVEDLRPAPHHRKDL